MSTICVHVFHILYHNNILNQKTQTLSMELTQTLYGVVLHRV